MKGPGWRRAAPVASRAGRVGLVPGLISPSMLSRSHSVIDPRWSPSGARLAWIDGADSCDVATVPLDGTQWPQRVSHADYAWDPSWSPDGRELAWHEWMLPDMPWDSSRIVVRDDDGKTRVVADAPGCGQPRFS